MQHRSFSWLLLLSLVLVLGCEQKTGTVLFTVAWPTARMAPEALVGAARLKVDLFARERTVASLTMARPADTDRTEITVPGVPIGSYTFLVTAYDAADTILGQAEGDVRVTEAFTAPLHVTARAQERALLTLTAPSSALIAGKTLVLAARAVNPDRAALLLPARGLRWSSDRPDVAVVDPVTGVVTGVSAGQATIHATDGDLLAGTFTVTVSFPQPTVSLQADRSYTKPGEPVKLTWTSREADRVEAAVNFNTELLNGSLTVYPVETTTYRLAVAGPGGAAESSVTIRVTHPAPTVTLEADAGRVSPGEHVTLTWYADGATAVVRAVNFNATALNGAVTVRPFQTTTYRITVRGPGGEASAEVTVAVAAQPRR
ncbi:MAG TPA: Ig-like domain-containing protein [Armatimonadota bacterium]|nr:Ig-like domain-containing protein [Armatimonadota bacterium]